MDAVRTRGPKDREHCRRDGLIELVRDGAKLRCRLLEGTKLLSTENRKGRRRELSEATQDLVDVRRKMGVDEGETRPLFLSGEEVCLMTLSLRPGEGRVEALSRFYEDGARPRRRGRSREGAWKCVFDASSFSREVRDGVEVRRAARCPTEAGGRSQWEGFP